MIAIVLLLFGIILIIVNIKAINKSKNSFENVLEYKVENMTELEEEIGQLRKDIAESLTDLQKDILDLRRRVDEIKVENNTEPEAKIESIQKISNDIEKLLDNQKDVVDNINKSSKTERVKELIAAGLSDDDICEKLSIGKGEVLLVRGLFK